MLLKSDLHDRFRAAGSRLVAIYEPMANNADGLSSPRVLPEESLLGRSVFLMPHGEHDQLGKGHFEFAQCIGKFPTKSPDGSAFKMWLAAIRVQWWTNSQGNTWSLEGADLLKNYNDKLTADPLVFIPEAVAQVFDAMQPLKA